ncbi:MAG: ATP-dependent DNA helicase DinG [Pseudomonadales bacterium]|nr:ATP-dependent DNA helicase DinG [Pseudomonadales bacterium]
MLTQAHKKSIQTAYSTLLKNKGLNPRAGQKQMIAEIARTITSVEADAEGKRINEAGVCAIEAGTGTGKTVAYILAVLPLAKALGKKVVISTATIALQEQILHRDLPDILKHSGIHFRFALAKGRGRYLCLSKLDLHLNSDVNQDTLFSMDSPAPAQSTDEETVQIYESMAKALLTSQWDGDKDSWKGELDDDIWKPLTADRNECAGRRCQHVAQCSFIKARDNLSAVDCVVANHDLVMADLALGGGAILTDPADTIYIFDEAHHLPDIALRHFSGALRINGAMHWFDQSIKAIRDIGSQNGSFIKLLDKLDLVPGLLLELKQIYGEVKPIVDDLVEPLLVDIAEQYQLPHYRFEQGVIPPVLKELSKVLSKRFDILVDELSAAHEIISGALDENDTSISLPQLENLFSDVGVMLNAAERQWALWKAYARDDDDMPDSRWIQVVESGGLLDFELSASPLMAARTLRQYLWKRCYAAVLTSATLTALGQFGRLSMHAGLPKYTQTAVVPSPFDYQKNARFFVPAMYSEPTDHFAHSAEIAEKLPALCEGYEGILVLFASRRQMNDVYDLLDDKWQAKVLKQNQMSKQKLLQQHIDQVDDTGLSVLFGLASLAEGVDLPGKYCGHVIIAKLPFSVPNDPVEAGLAEWFETQGRNPFMEISLPDASQRLIQACGRLIRTETDQGQVTLMDKRILTKRYGRLILDSLPPFRQILEAP